ncbi:MAG TPA: sugar ABC transporter permease [Kosmotogaceae bacterium]|nr:MAG: Permease component of ABC-type sugar transporter [Thermotogales bacterium 46_20]HAA86206.1 sugar ABC transporter permease [Kosmotogaceae bacterium]
MQTRFTNRFLPYLLLSPSVAIVVIFLVIPTIQSLYLSFFRISPFGDRKIYVGLSNFSKLFESEAYWNSLIITLIFALAVVAIGISLAVVLASFLNLKLRGMTTVRVLMIWTYAISPALAGTIWALMFDPSSGPLVYIVRQLFGVRLNWMMSGNIALVAIIIAASWKMLGYNIIFFLAGLQMIPDELLEAASIDGASPVRRFFRITLPLLSPTTFFLLIMNTLYAFFQVFGLIDVMTRGGPGDATEVLIYKLYRDGFVTMDTGYASAQSVVLFVFVAILTVLQFKYAERRVFYG